MTDPVDSLADVFPDALALRLDRQGRIISLNATASTCLGLAAGDDILTCIESADGGSLLSALQIMQTEDAETCRFSATFSTTGRDRMALRGWLSRGTASPDGQLTMVALAEPADGSDAEQFRKLADLAIQGIFVHRGERLLYANQRMAEILGYNNPVELMAIDSILDHVHPDDLPNVRRRLQARLHGYEQIDDYEIRVIHKTGETVWMYMRGSTVTWDGESAIAGACVDISVLKRALRNQQQTEALFRRVFELSPEMVTLSGLEDGRYHIANKMFVETFGPTEEKVIGKTSAELNLWKSYEDRDRLISQIKRDGSVQGYETVVLRHDGSELPVSLSASLVDIRGETELLMVGRDITDVVRQRRELSRSKEEAELANRAKSEFLANMSHELRTPLNAIIGFSELMKEETMGPLGSDVYRGYCGDILGAGRHLLDIINDILDLSKLEAGHMDLDLRPVSVRQTMEQSLRLLNERARQAQVDLRAVLPDPAMEVMADDRRLKQILINLLSNAVKFTRDGEIALGAERLSNGRLIRIEVRDTGPGMSEENIATALSPFGQVEAGISRNHDGAGLGLPLAKALTEMQNGEFFIDSAPGRGTTVGLTLPAVDDRA